MEGGLADLRFDLRVTNGSDAAVHGAKVRLNAHSHNEWFVLSTIGPVADKRWS